MSFTSSQMNPEFSAWQNSGVLANPAHEMRTNTRNKFSSKLPFAGAILCGIFLAMVVTVNAGPARWSSKDKNVAVAPEEPFNWTGFYFGGHVGGVWNDYDFGSFDTDVNVSEQFFGVPDFEGPGSDIFVRFHTPGEDPSDDCVIGGGRRATTSSLDTLSSAWKQTLAVLTRAGRAHSAIPVLSSSFRTVVN